MENCKIANCRKIPTAQGYCSTHHYLSRRKPGVDYVKIFTPDGRHIREHRYVMEKHIGRRLRRDEHVHHVNGKIRDNRIENLELMTDSEHMTHHNKGAYKNPNNTETERQCPDCMRVLLRKDFYRCGNKTDKCQAHCKECHSKKMIAYRLRRKAKRMSVTSS